MQPGLRLHVAPLQGGHLGPKGWVHDIYIYIYLERERERERENKIIVTTRWGSLRLAPITTMVMNPMVMNHLKNCNIVYSVHSIAGAFTLKYMNFVNEVLYVNFCTAKPIESLC